MRKLSTKRFITKSEDVVNVTIDRLFQQTKPK